MDCKAKFPIIDFQLFLLEGHLIVRVAQLAVEGIDIRSRHQASVLEKTASPMGLNLIELIL